MRRLWTYENGLVLLMSLANGVVTLDRLAVSFLSPYIVNEFHINNTQLGLLASALSVAVAGSGYLLASLADSTRLRKQILLGALLLFSLCSALSGLAGSFAFLILARAVLGVTEGPIVPIAQSIVSIQSSEHRRGLNMGIMLNLGSALIGIGLGPILATHIADAFGWRAAFFVSCIPGLMLVISIALMVRPINEAPHAPVAVAAGVLSGIRKVLNTRNIALCIAISGFYSGWLIIQSVFLPLYLVRVDGLKPTDMGLVVAATGIATAVAGMAVPALSDRIGRRPALAFITFFGALAPLATLFVHGAPPLLAVALFIGYLGGGAGPLYVGIIPSESVPPRYVASAVAIALAAGELIGGVAAPAVAGRAADLFGMAAPFWISAAAAAFCGVLSLFLVETAPRKLRAAAV